jgi:polyketide synthase 12/myxalamid-type polyketide synthase MxaB
MAARLHPREHRRWASQGISLIEPGQAVDALDRLMTGSLAQAAVLAIDWRRAARQWPAGGAPTLVTELVDRWAGSADRQEPRADLRTELASAMAAERAGLVQRRVMREALKILGLAGSPETIDPRQPLNELGLDSLMAVELRNALGAAVGETLPATLLFRYPTVDALASFLARDVLKVDAAGDEPTPIAQPETDEAAAGVERLGDDDVKRLLAEELASLSSTGWMKSEW